jgi:hypothetical protein
MVVIFLLGKMRVLRETHTKPIYFGTLSYCGQNVADTGPGKNRTTSGCTCV